MNAEVDMPVKEETPRPETGIPASARPSSVSEDQHFDTLLFDEVRNIDKDQDYWFSLRGSSINLLIDAATPLVGMVLRVSRMASCDNIDTVYKQSVEEIKAIEMELTEAGYEHAVILSYRYILCSFIDEAVMSSPWGADCSWAEHSLLTRFHNETWGGEKVFAILTRLQAEPVRYRESLEFIFFCLRLGFEGRYKVMENGQEELRRVVSHLYDTLRLQYEDEPETLTSATDRVVTTRYRIGRQLPVWTVFAGFSVAWIVVYLGYSFALHNKTADVLERLSQILQ